MASGTVRGVASRTLSAIYVYPIKSCRAVALDSVTVSTIGLSGDRLWQVVDGGQRGLTQRQHRVLATVQPEHIFEQSAPFSDAAPILLTAEQSLAWLVERASESFDMDRFRPNLVVRGSEPWEDTWATVRIGAAELRCAVPWPRCAIPQMDQVTADRHREPAKVLRRHRRCTEAPTLRPALRGLVEGNSLFGVACAIGRRWCRPAR